MLDENTIKIFFIWEKLLPITDTDFYLDFRIEIKLKTILILNLFELILTCLEKFILFLNFLRLVFKIWKTRSQKLNFLRLVHLNQNNIDIEKSENNKAAKNCELIFYINHFTDI